MSPRPQRMLFVCLNDRGEDHPKGSCSRSGGAELLDRLRADIHERGLKGAVRAVGTRCLGQCARGPVVCVQPEDVWYGDVQPKDAAALMETHVLDGRPVARLLLEDGDLVGKDRAEVPLEPFWDPED